MGRVASADFVHPTTRGRRENCRVDAVRQRTSPQRDRQNGEQNAAQGHYLSAYGVSPGLRCLAWIVTSVDYVPQRGIAAQARMLSPSRPAASRRLALAGCAHPTEFARYKHRRVGAARRSNPPPSAFIRLDAWFPMRCESPQPEKAHSIPKPHERPAPSSIEIDSRYREITLDVGQVNAAKRREQGMDIATQAALGRLVRLAMCGTSSARNYARTARSAIIAPPPLAPVLPAP